MKIQFDREEILQKLKKASQFVPQKAVISAYETFLFDIGQGDMKITATDGQKQITIKCDLVKNDVVGMFTIPAKQLMHVLGLLLEKEVFLTVKGNSVELKCGKSKYNMPSESGNEYPLMPPINPTSEASFTGAVMNMAIETTVPYVNGDNASPALQGVCMRGDDKNNINFYGCDSHHAAKVVIRPRSINRWDDIIIPKSTINAINKCVADDIVVDIFHNGEKMEIITDELMIRALAYNQKYPKIEIFFDGDPPSSVELNTVQVLHALQRLDVFTKVEVPLIKVDLKTSTMLISASDEAYNHDAHEELDIVAENELTIGFNIKLFTNVIKSIKSDTFKMFYEDFNKAVRIEPVALNNNNDKFFIVMPIKI